MYLGRLAHRVLVSVRERKQDLKRQLGLRGPYSEEQASVEYVTINGSKTNSKTKLEQLNGNIKASTESFRGRDPYFVQVGLDFGTCYCKSICRDIMISKAWVHVPETTRDGERPFLIPSALQLCKGTLKVGSPLSHYHSAGLPHLKIALVKAALGSWNDPVLAPYREAFGCDPPELKRSIIACAVYLLAGILGGIKKDILGRYPGFGEHPRDYEAVNMAIPVADAEQKAVSSLFQTVLNMSFALANDYAGHPHVRIDTVNSAVDELLASRSEMTGECNGPCFIYPEVSAGVQGYVRSRASRSGTYLFSDTGAGSVDQSVFILGRNKSRKKKLVYVSAEVWPLGSSEIESRASRETGEDTWEGRERWRRLKEKRLTSDKTVAHVLDKARLSVAEDLTERTAATLFRAKPKLGRDQFAGIALMFGGGGHTANPYERGVRNAFADKRVYGNTAVDPECVGMQVPRDLEPRETVELWMPRLWVAYGLSFVKEELADHKYPSQVSRLVERRQSSHRMQDFVRKEDT
jgi:hypothetical protein